MALPTTPAPEVAAAPLGGPLDFALLNRAGHAELNLPDAPEAMRLLVHNRGATPVVAAAGATITLQFRPGTLRGITRVGLSHGLHHAWHLAADEPAHTLTLTTTQHWTLAAGETTTVHLAGCAGDPAGGTRATRVRVHYSGLGPPAAPLAGRQLVHLAVRRSKIDPPDLVGTVGAGSVAVAGPFTAGFTTGAAALNGGQALNELHLQIVNTSGAPVRLAGSNHDGDDATRLVLDYRTAGATVPWGLLAEHGDHLTLAQPEGWTLERSSLRRDTDAAWSPGAPLVLDIELHTDAPTHQAQLILRFENLPDHDDTEMVLLVDVGPFAIHDQRTATINPIELWGEQARLDFSVASAAGDVDTAGRASLRATGNNVLRLAAEWLRIVERKSWGVLNPAPDEAALELGIADGAAAIQSRGRLHLRLNPEGQPVSIGPGALPVAGAALTVGGNLRIATDGVATALRLGLESDHSWMQTDEQAPMTINARGGAVGIGMGAAPLAGSALTVNGTLSIRGQPPGEPGSADLVLASGAYASVISGRSDKRLHINPNGGRVLIGANALSFAPAALTVGNGLIVIDDLRNPGVPGHSLALCTTTEGQTELHFGIAGDSSWMQSNKPLLINPNGRAVFVGMPPATNEAARYGAPAALNVGGAGRFHDPTVRPAGGAVPPGLLELRRCFADGTLTGLDINAQQYAVVMQSGDTGTPLYLNPYGNLVVVDFDNFRFRIGGALFRFVRHHLHYEMAIGADIDIHYVRLDPA